MSVSVVKEPHAVKVRKPHVCQGCGNEIKIGEQVILSSYADDRDIWTFYECDECNEYRNKKCSLCKDYEYCIGENYKIGTIKECKQEVNK